MTILRTYLQAQDKSGEIVSNQVESALNTVFLPASAANYRTVINGSGQTQAMADTAVGIRGSKQIIWSSEGFTNSNGVVFPAVTTNQKKATNTSTGTNMAAPSATLSGGSPVPSGWTTPAAIDFSPYKSLLFLLNVTTVTGTSMQWELDFLDDTGTPVVFAFKTTALTAAGQLVMNIGRGATTQASSPPTSYGAFTDVAGTLVYPLSIDPAPQGQIAWTASSITACAWTGWLYGIA